MAISRVQVATPAASQAVSSLTINFPSALTPGNLVVVATNGLGTAGIYVTSSDTTIRWTGTSSFDNTNNNGSPLRVFYGVVIGSGITSVTLRNNGSTTMVAVGAEYSGGISVLDRYAEAGGNPSGGITVGPTGSTTVANELWIGAVGWRGSGTTFSAPTNGFGIVASAGTNDGNSADRNVCLLERIVSSAGAASFSLSTNANIGFTAQVAALRREGRGYAVAY